jgi:Na+-translocating ferredoxin:NAD+ oxidoreductase RnfG subunit
MKIVFKIRTVFVAAALLFTLLSAVPARAQAVYYSTRDLLSDFFKKSQAVSYKIVSVGPAERDRLLRKLGYAPQKGSYTFYIATTDSHVDGYALIDEEKGEHLPITFAVKLSTEGVVLRQEIVAYREVRGDEVRDERFRKQFVGKCARDLIACGQDIAAVSGATISSRAMAVGVKRAVVLFEELVKPTQIVSSASPAAAQSGRPAGSL